MRKCFLLYLFSALAFAACSRSEEPREGIKITRPAPEKGGKVESWEIVHDSWAGDADRDLVREVRQALNEDGDTVPFAEAVAIDARNGSVVLRSSGAYTLTFYQWQTVGRRVKSVKGVKDVEIKSRVAAE